MVMWDEIALQISKEFPAVKWDKVLVDAATDRMVNRPATLDTIVATNLHADILSDLAAALAGSLGIAPRAILTQSAVTRPCLNLSTDQLSTSWAKAWQTQWARFGAV